MPEELVQAFKPDYVVPLVLLLTADKVPEPSTGLLYEVGSGWQGRTRWQRSGGCRFSSGLRVCPEIVAGKWAQIVDFDDGKADHPSSAVEANKEMYATLREEAESSSRVKL